MPDQPKDDEPTYPCKTCGRRFIKSSLVKHEPACKKITKMQRKIFDSGKQRAQGTEIPLAHIQKAKKEREKLGGFFPRPKTQWRERHEEFISAVSASKQVEHALKTGAPLPPPPKTSVNSVYLDLDPADCMTLYGYVVATPVPSSPSYTPRFLRRLKRAKLSNKLIPLSIDSNYIECDYCGRRFNRHAAERHIPFCEEQSKRRGTTAKPQTRSASMTRASTNRRASDQPPTTSSKNRSSRENSVTRSDKRAPTSNRRSSQERPPATRGQDGHRQNAASATHAPRTSHLPTPVKRSNSASRVPPTASGNPKSSYEKRSNGYLFERPPKTGNTTSYGRAPKTATSVYGGSPKSSYGSYEKAPKTGNATSYGRAPKTSSSSYDRAPKTSSNPYERAPKTSASTYERAPKTGSTTSYGRAPKTSSNSYERAPKTGSGGSTSYGRSSPSYSGGSSPKTPKSRGQTSQKRNLDTSASRRTRSSSRKRN